MATVKIILYKSKLLANGEYPIMLRFSNYDKRCFFSIGLSAKEENWDPTIPGVRGRNLQNKEETNMAILQQKMKADKIVLALKSEERDITVDEFSRRFRKTIKRVTVFEYFEMVIDELCHAGHVSNAEAYRDSLRAIRKYRNGRDFEFSDVTVTFLNEFENAGLSRGLKPSTISAWLRTLRAVMNRAIRGDFCKKEYYPFHEYKISKLRIESNPRAITRDDIKRLAELDLEELTDAWFAREYFVFIYLCQGISFFDLAKLKISDLRNEYIYYLRSKTGQPVKVPLHHKALLIINKFRE